MNGRKIIPVQKRPGVDGADFIYWCPGCEDYHGVWVLPRAGATWEWNGSMDSPTFSPSLLLRYTKVPAKDPATGDWRRDAAGSYVLNERGQVAGAVDVVCHCFIADGKIRFLSDCTHRFAGQVVDMKTEDE